VCVSWQALHGPAPIQGVVDASQPTLARVCTFDTSVLRLWAVNTAVGRAPCWNHVACCSVSDLCVCSNDRRVDSSRMRRCRYHRA
jgi:hypothetical protein